MVEAGSSFVGRRWPTSVGWATVIVLTAFVVVLDARHLVRAGPLWRDEISTAQIPMGPTWAEWYRNKVYNDSSPALWDGVVRAWTAVGLGGSDAGLRGLGLIVGLGIVGALWLNARTFGARAPVASLALLGLNGFALCYGDSLRTYGPGMLAGLLCTGAVFSFARANGRRSVTVALVRAQMATLVAVHVNFFDAAWVLAACVGGAAVCGARGRWGRAVGVLVIGAVSGGSLAVYAGLFRERAAMGTMYAYQTTVPAVFAALRQALGRTPLYTLDSYVPIWCAATALAVLVGMSGWLATRRDGSPNTQRRADGALFSLVLLVVGVAAYIGVLRALGDSLAWSHYLVLFALVATSLDGLLAVVVRPGRQLLITAAACAVALAWAGDAWRSASVRMSNVDRVSARLATLARPGDLILVDPWWMGCAVDRYYHGPGDVVTVPPVADLQLQRFDTVMRAFDDPHAIDPLLDRLAATARAGGRVWVIMHPTFTLAADPRTPLPQPQPGWNEVDYYALWTRQVALALQRDFGVRRVDVVVDGSDDVNLYENLQLLAPAR